MASSVLTRQSVKSDALLAGQTIGCDCYEAPLVIYGSRWSSRRNSCCGCRLASALAGTGNVCSETFEFTNGDTPVISEAGPTRGGAMLGTLEDEVCNTVEDCVDTSSGKLNIKRTGKFISSASIASRWATETNTYPGESIAPTVNGRAGFPSTAISAAPWPTLLAMTPDKTNLSAGLGPEPACSNGVAPSSRANATVLVISGSFNTGGASAV